MSLMAALQPSDIKEAVEATQGNPITRTKLRLVYVVARVMFELDPIDVGDQFRVSFQSQKQEHLDQMVGPA